MTKFYSHSFAVNGVHTGTDMNRQPYFRGKAICNLYTYNNMIVKCDFKEHIKLYQYTNLSRNVEENNFAHF